MRKSYCIPTPGINSRGNGYNQEKELLTSYRIPRHIRLVRLDDLHICRDHGVPLLTLKGAYVPRVVDTSSCIASSRVTEVLTCFHQVCLSDFRHLSHVCCPFLGLAKNRVRRVRQGETENPPFIN